MRAPDAHTSGAGALDPARASLLHGLQGLIFDCDGVMFDSWESNKLYYNLILARLGLGPMNPDQERYVHSHAVKACLEYITPRDRWPEMEAARVSVSYVDEILPHLTPEPDLFPLLERLKAEGVRMAVHTNRTNTMHLLVQRFGFDAFFNPVLSAAEVRPKPDPEGVEVILQQWDADPAKVAFIGDSDLDEQTAVNGGVRFWAFRSPGLSAELHLTDFTSLMGLFDVARQGARHV
ncbi:MAG: HAD family hydrolase [Desulfovibrionaceae bacterium]